MLNLIYISHLRPGKQRNLAYAMELAQAFRSPLSILSASCLRNYLREKKLLWNPNRSKVKNGKIPSFEREIIYNKREKKLPVFLLGKSLPQDRIEPSEHHVVRQVMAMGFPLFILPYDYTFKGIRNVLFTGNAPGFTDHRLKHQIAATFLPRAFKLENSDLKRIHWNNISHIPETSRQDYELSYRALNNNIHRFLIDLIVFPVTSAFRGVRELLLYQSPVLLIPVKANEWRLAKKKSFNYFPEVQQIE